MQKKKQKKKTEQTDKPYSEILKDWSLKESLIWNFNSTIFFDSFNIYNLSIH